MIEWKEGVVIKISHEREGIQIATVLVEEDRNQERNGNRKTETAINYVEITGPVHKGDKVTLNTTAVRLGLGTGGKHFISCIKNRNNYHPGFEAKSKGHIMKLRYTPIQMAVLSCEEEDSPFRHVFELPLRPGMGGKRTDFEEYETVWSEMGNILRQTPVLIFELHSMLPILVACMMKQRKKDLRIIYLMTDDAALPLVLSDHVACLKKMGWITGTITTGHAFGGDLESVNIYSGLWAAKKVYNADIIIAGAGPGVVGTGTSVGFSAMEMGNIINAVNRMGGIPIMVPRISFADPRNRHTGLSHHTLHALHLSAYSPAIIPYPLHFSDIEQQVNRARQWNNQQHLWVGKEPPSPGQLEKWLHDYPLDIQTMGRKIHDDPVFFQSTSLCAGLALFLLDHRPIPRINSNDGNGDAEIKNLLTKWVVSPRF